jgi:PAS domain S-box-containing protein
MKILIVDDKKENLYILESLLRGNSYHVITAINGAQALEKLYSEGADMIISDILMPKMDGFQFCLAVHKDDKLKDIPFIFYTATYTDHKDEEFALKCGANRFVRKPIEPDEFLKIIKEAVCDVKNGKGATKKPPLKDEDETYKLYSERLVKKLEKKMWDLEISEARYSSLINDALDTSRVGLFILDRDFKIVWMNKAMECYFGLQREQVLGNDKRQLIQKQIKDIMEDPERFSDRVLTAYANNTYIENFECHVLPDENRGECWLQHWSQPIHSGLYAGGRVEHYYDISKSKRAEKEKKRLQAKLLQTQKMESIGTLAGGIAHDFNNILTVILGFTELAIVQANKGEVSLENLQEVLMAGMRAKDLIKQILAFSRQNEQEFRPVRVKLIAKEVLKLLRSTLPTTIEIRENTQSDSLVMADLAQIHQVLMNLCINAGQAMQKTGGILEVGLADVRLDSEFASKHPDVIPGSFLRLTVSDTGHGMPPDIIDRIFDPFFTTKEKGGGTGLGLAVVHGIVKSLKGIITAYSQPEKGTTFNIFLPVLEREAEREKKTEEPLPTGTERILFVDDEPPLLDLGKKILEPLGYQVEVRSSAVEALELFKAHPERFDLVITDMTMPNMTGDRLSEELMAIRPDIPVILCTGFSTNMDEKKAKAMGIRTFTFKPILKRDIAVAIRKVLDE